MTDNDLTFGLLLRAAREKTGMTMGALARALDVSVPYISDVERGQRAPLSDEKLERVVSILHADRSALEAAAARYRGAVKVDKGRVGKRGFEVMNSLARRAISDEQWEKIAELIGGDGMEGK